MTCSDYTRERIVLDSIGLARLGSAHRSKFQIQTRIFPCLFLEWSSLGIVYGTKAGRVQEKRSEIKRKERKRKENRKETKKKRREEKRRKKKRREK